MIRFARSYPFALVAALLALAPSGTMATDAPASSPVNVTVEPGSLAVRVRGTIPGAHGLQAALYATFAADVPIVLLTRRPLPTDADGHFDATFPIAPAFESGTVITVIVQTSASVSLGRASVAVPPPSAPQAAPT